MEGAVKGREMPQNEMGKGGPDKYIFIKASKTSEMSERPQTPY